MLSNDFTAKLKQLSENLLPTLSLSNLMYTVIHMKRQLMLADVISGSVPSHGGLAAPRTSTEELLCLDKR